MRKNLLLIYALCLYLPIPAQVKKLYVYKQKTYGGAREANAGNEENNIGQQQVNTGYTTYFIFAEFVKRKPLVFEQLWINKERYNFRIDTLLQLPYVLPLSGIGEKLSKDTLVPIIDGYVIELKDLVQIIPQPSTISIKETILENAIVLLYRYNNKLFKIFCKNIKEISPVFAP